MESIVVETAVMRDPHVRWCERGEPKLPLLDFRAVVLFEFSENKIEDNKYNFYKTNIAINYIIELVMF